MEDFFNEHLGSICSEPLYDFDSLIDRRQGDRRSGSSRREDDRRTGERRMSENNYQKDTCPLQKEHIAAISNLDARMYGLEKKMDIIDRIDKNLEVLTSLYERQEETNRRQEVTNGKFEKSIEKLAEAISNERIKGTISFNEILNKLFWLLLGGGAIYAISEIVKNIPQ